MVMLRELRGCDITKMKSRELSWHLRCEVSFLDHHILTLWVRGGDSTINSELLNITSHLCVYIPTTTIFGVIFPQYMLGNLGGLFHASHLRFFFFLIPSIEHIFITKGN